MGEPATARRDSHNGMPRLLFVGAFTPAEDGVTGGTYVACKQLMDSPLHKAFKIVKIDTSQASGASRQVWHRTLAGAGRLVRVARLALLRRIDSAMIFATLGPSWFERGLLALFCRAGGIPVYLLPRCAEVNEAIEENLLVRRFTAFLVRTGVRFVFQGEALRRRFLAVFPEAVDQVHVQGNWIDLRWGAGVGAPPPPNGKTVVMYMGWLHPMKGVDILLEGISRHASSLADCRFVLCGDGVDRPALEAAAAQTGLEIEFRGWVHGAEKLRAFSESQIVVLPSRVEGMPNALLEAMSVSRPVVATNVGSVADLVENGVEGLVVPANDPDALAGALRALASNPALRAQFGSAGRRKIETDHNIDIAWRKLARLLGGGSVPIDGGDAIGDVADSQAH